MTGAQTTTDLIAALRAGVTGEVVGPDHDDYDDVRVPWNLVVVHQNPAAVVLAVSADDVRAAVRIAAEHGAGVAVQTTGHGVVHPCDGAVLINTALMRDVRVDPERRVATVAAGALWGDVLTAAAAHGLAPLAGTSPDVGVIGFTLGGGHSWLSRRYGLTADTLVEATVVTADGQTRTVDAEHEPDLLWALRGAGANFGVVTSATIELVPVPEVYAGALIFPVQRAREVLEAYRDWSATAPDEVSSVLALIRLPEMLSSLAPLDGQLVQVLICDVGGEKVGAERIASLRALGPVADTVTTIPIVELGSIAKDSVDPLPLNEHGHLVGELSAELVETLLAVNGPDAPPGLPLIAVRQLGGRLADGHPDGCYGHRQAGFLVNATGADLTPETGAMVDKLQEAMSARLEPFAVGGVGANFIGKARGGRAGDEARTRDAFAPEDYQRLAELKLRYDPENLFRFNHNVPPAKS
ncbi:MAG: FAD-binding oxidoreductase [Actinocatenispora sp.]